MSDFITVNGRKWGTFDDYPLEQMSNTGNLFDDVHNYFADGLKNSGTNFQSLQHKLFENICVKNITMIPDLDKNGRFYIKITPDKSKL